MGIGESLGNKGPYGVLLRVLSASLHCHTLALPQPLSLSLSLFFFFWGIREGTGSALGRNPTPSRHTSGWSVGYSDTIMESQRMASELAVRLIQPHRAVHSEKFSGAPSWWESKSCSSPQCRYSETTMTPVKHLRAPFLSTDWCPLQYFCEVRWL